MAEFFSFLKVFLLCGTTLFIATLVLLSMRQSRLRSVGMEIVKLGTVAGLAILTISPIDLIPFLPIDDVFYVIGAFIAGKWALDERRWRAFVDEAEQLRIKRGEVRS